MKKLALVVAAAFVLTALGSAQDWKCKQADCSVGYIVSGEVIWVAVPEGAIVSTDAGWILSGGWGAV